MNSVFGLTSVQVSSDRGSKDSGVGVNPASLCRDSLRASYFTAVPPFPHLSNRDLSIQLTELFREL